MCAWSDKSVERWQSTAESRLYRVLLLPHSAPDLGRLGGGPGALARASHLQAPILKKNGQFTRSFSELHSAQRMCCGVRT